MKLRKLGLALLTAALLLSLAPAALAVTVKDQGVGYSAVLYDNTNGLPTSETNAVVQDSRGFIWIGSYSGLIRYDGNDFVRYDSSSGLSSVICLYIDSRDRLWIGTNDSGAAVLEDNRFTFYGREQGLGSAFVRAFCEDENGNLLIGTTLGVSFVDPQGELHPLDDAQLNGEYINQLLPGPQAVIYGDTWDGDVFTVKDLRLTGFYPGDSLCPEGAYSILPDPDEPGAIYLGTEGTQILHGRLEDSMAGAEVFQTDPLFTVNALSLTGDTLWVCANNGIGYLNAEGRVVQLDNLPMTGSVTGMMEDFERNLWFTSSRQGIMKLTDNRFTDISLLAGLDTMVVNSTCLYGDDLYLGTDNGVVVLSKSYRQKENAVTRLLVNTRIRSIIRDSQNRLWFCSFGDHGAVRYDPATDSYLEFNTERGVSSNLTRTVRELSNGAIALATSNGVNFIEGDEVQSVFGSGEGLDNTVILSVEEGPDGAVYLGTDGGGIYVLRGGESGTVEHLGLEDGLSSEVILRLKKDPHENLCWIVTSNTLAYLRNGKVTTVKSFPYSNNFDLFFDSQDRVWVLSSNGIYVVSREELLANRDISYLFFDSRSGLPCVATANAYSELREDGTLFIAGTSGVSTVNLNENVDDHSEVRLAVPYLMADDRYIPVEGDEALHIPADCKRLSISAHAFTYSLNNPYVHYQLIGFDDEPVTVSKRDLETLNYTNLNGGEYTFRMALINTMTGQEDRSLEITIVKEKAFYEQWWFWVLLGLLVVLLTGVIVYLFFRRKTKELERKHQETKALVDQMTTAFARCIDGKDRYTNGHSFRVAKYTCMLAERLGKTPEEVEDIRNIALLHDIGKITIPDKILNKPDRLTDEEFQVMRSHAQRGYEILREIKIAPELALGAAYHHERIDGRGYPKGLKGDEIPEIAQIIAVADTFDAMYSRRVYHKGASRSLEDVVAELERVKGTQLNPQVVEAFVQLAAEGAFDHERDEQPPADPPETPAAEDEANENKAAETAKPEE